MPRYNKKNIKDLKKELYNNYIHDAKIENIQYNRGEDSIRIALYNPIFDVNVELTFLDIAIALTIKGEWFGNRDTVLSLTVEEDFSYLKDYLVERSKFMEDSLYLLFQMFSGDELHIVSKEVIIE